MRIFVIKTNLDMIFRKNSCVGLPNGDLSCLAPFNVESWLRPCTSVHEQSLGVIGLTILKVDISIKDVKGAAQSRQVEDS